MAAETEIRTFLCRSDNIGVLIRDPATGACAAIDVPEAGPVLKALDETGWHLTDILVTHRHGDHVEGIPAVKRATGAKFVPTPTRADTGLSSRLPNGSLTTTRSRKRSNTSPTPPTPGSPISFLIATTPGTSSMSLPMSAGPAERPTSPSANRPSVAVTTWWEAIVNPTRTTA